MMATIVLIKKTFCQQMISDVVWLVMTNISGWLSGAFVKSWERLLPLIISKHQFSPSRREVDNDEIMSNEEEDLDYYDDDTDSEIPSVAAAEYNHQQTWKPKFYAIQNWFHPILQFCWSVHLHSKSCQAILLIYRPQATCLMCDSLQAMSNSFYAYWAKGIPHICHFFYTGKIFGE